MNYPPELLPQDRYRIMDTADLPGSVILLRRLNYRCGHVPFDDFGELPAKVLLGHESLSKAGGLSLNMCGVYRPEHLQLRARPSVACPGPDNYWYPGDWLPSVDDIDFERDPACCPARLHLADVHGMPFPTKNDQLAQSGHTVSGLLKAEHRPTLANFWHFELQFYGDEGKPVTGSGTAWKRKAYEFVVRNLVQHVHVDGWEFECAPVPEDAYLSD